MHGLHTVISFHEECIPCVVRESQWRSKEEWPEVTRRLYPSWTERRPRPLACCHYSYRTGWMDNRWTRDILPGRIFTNPTLIELRQEIRHYDWLTLPRADDVVLCSRMEIITKQAIECGLGISLGFCCLDYNLKNNPLA
ncbi:hypothetical protein AVEN_24885-1 [Araneus ventricosus]|uniref:Uncharacterized protein n=1 Tax=Araneus ventricosus TaxID=182803 RepID=A0A4Y2B6U1_ARAVE|nr:hypothetical protein AVEN_24885-1 [Araneus ventricosus]